MDRNMNKCERTKSRKLERLRRQKEREDELRNELNGEDIVKSKKERRKLGVKTRKMIDKPGELGREFTREITRKAIRRERRGEKENLNSLQRV